jgi:hypothetical protein
MKARDLPKAYVARVNIYNEGGYTNQKGLFTLGRSPVCLPPEPLDRNHAFRHGGMCPAVSDYAPYFERASFNLGPFA